MIDLIQWDEQNNKWMDVHNDFFCSERDGQWEVRCRYVFDDYSGQPVDENERVKEFPTREAAMEFFVNFLFRRHFNLSNQPRKRAA